MRGAEAEFMRLLEGICSLSVLA